MDRRFHCPVLTGRIVGLFRTPGFERNQRWVTSDPRLPTRAASSFSIGGNANLMHNDAMGPHWLDLARRFQALAQIGLAYCKDPYDRERYQEIRLLAAEMIARGT